MQSNIKVSVVIPIYNVEDYLRESVLSIINQSLKDIEIILVDDGSTDSSQSIIKEFEKLDCRIQVISNPNQGLSIARNLGIYKAQGEYIYFFDSDDLLELDALETCYNKCKSENLDFLFFDADVFSEQELETCKFNYVRAGLYDDRVYSGIEMLYKQINDSSYSASACLNFINRIFLEKNKLYFYPKIIHEDELFTFLLYLKANRVGLQKANYFHRRVRMNSIMTSKISLKNIIGYLTVCRELKSYYYQYDTNKNEKKIIRIKITQILWNLLYMLKFISLEEQSYLMKIIDYELLSLSDFKFQLRFKVPNIFFFFHFCLCHI